MNYEFLMNTSLTEKHNKVNEKLSGIYLKLKKAKRHIFEKTQNPIHR